MIYRLFDLADEESANIIVQQFVERYRESPLREYQDS